MAFNKETICNKLFYFRLCCLSDIFKRKRSYIFNFLTNIRELSFCSLKFFHISFNILAFKQFGQVPCLYDDNEQIVQSGAILRHLARKHGAYVSTTFCCFVRRLYLQEFELRIGELRNLKLLARYKIELLFQHLLQCF